MAEAFCSPICLMVASVCADSNPAWVAVLVPLLSPYKNPNVEREISFSTSWICARLSARLLALGSAKLNDPP